jgi:hypothetical protein
MADQNPKVDTPPLSNAKKDSDDWVSGEEPMTGVQASFAMLTLSHLAGAGKVGTGRCNRSAHEIVTNLECAGRNSQEARKLLRDFEACLVLQAADRDRLDRQLGL